MHTTSPPTPDADGRRDPAAARGLFETLYADLHRVARRELRRQSATDALGATTLLHEAFLDLSKNQGIAFADRPHFLAYAARAMRGLIIDEARSRHAQKRGGLLDITRLRTDVADGLPDDGSTSLPPETLERIGAALDRLAAVDGALAELVDLRFFCGFSIAEVAGIRGVSERTVQRDWQKARIYLHRTLRETAATG